ncbi:MAG: hypothetical protein J2P54_25060 [Bradyrhizobiaceae bacterium]|nr:hypothetical protein [Bradyrhizobiaceae bacterium]
MRATGFAGLGLTIGLVAIGFAINHSWSKLTAWRDANLARIQQAPGLFGRPKPTGQQPNPADFAWIERAMADCDTEAGKHLDSLYFLVMPLASTDGNVERWSPLSLGQIGTSVTLLKSQDALDGLRDGSLTLYQGQFVFSILEPSSNVTYRWKPATGVSEFITQEALSIKSFKPGLQVVGVDPDTGWADALVEQSPSCFWVSALLRT